VLYRIVRFTPDTLVPPRADKDQRVPRLVLLTDARNDHGLERALRRLPRGSALVFRHYHLEPVARAARLRVLTRICAMRGIAVVRAGIGYGPAGRLSRRAALRLATAHDLRDIGAAVRAGADAVLLSPVFPTRSHPGAPVLGALRFNCLARLSPVPVLALGGMTRRRMAQLRTHGFAAIDGLT
jgi:thiamine-phosphate pyrophosphorylase